MHTSLSNIVSEIHPMPDAFWHSLAPLLVRQTLPRRTLLLREGQVCGHLHFLEQGLVRAFHHRDGQEVTSWFMREGDFVISVYSFYSRRPSHENIELLEESTLVSLSHAHLQQLYLEFPAFNIVGRLLTERYYVLSEARAISLRTQTAPERYEALLAARPDLFRRAPLKHIASYLGMAPETLSRLRARRG